LVVVVVLSGHKVQDNLEVLVVVALLLLVVVQELQDKEIQEVPQVVVIHIQVVVVVVRLHQVVLIPVQLKLVQVVQAVITHNLLMQVHQLDTSLVEVVADFILVEWVLLLELVASVVVQLDLVQQLLKDQAEHQILAVAEVVLEIMVENDQKVAMAVLVLLLLDININN